MTSSPKPLPAYTFGRTKRIDDSTSLSNQAPARAFSSDNVPLSQFTPFPMRKVTAPTSAFSFGTVTSPRQDDRKPLPAFVGTNMD